MKLSSIKRRHVGMATLILSVALVAWRLGDTFIEDDNFRALSPSLYRSGQLRTDEWHESLKHDRYRSVLNLRGAKPGAHWYDEEVAFAAAKGLTHYDFALSAGVMPTLEQMNQLVALMRDAPKPLLIHCKNGADRSGLVAALYLHALQGLPAEQAAGQLSLWYGHFPWFGSRSMAMDQALASYIAAHDVVLTRAKVAGLY